MAKAHICPVILAGGASSRLWPASGKEKPKWDLRLFGTKDSKGQPQSLLEGAWERARALAPAADCFVITGAPQETLARSSLPELPDGNLLVEPEPRDTAGAVAYGTGILINHFRRHPLPPGEEPVMLVLPGDHVIHPVSSFVECAGKGALAATELRALVTFGIVPRKPGTAYGYIHRGPELTLPSAPPNSPKLYRVLQFREKPTAQLAREYLDSGEHFWNGGIFLWTLETITKEFERQLPGHAALIKALGEAADPDKVIAAQFPKLRKTSIDFGVMENAQNTAALAADFEWDDIGSWSAIGEHLDRLMDNVVGPETKLITVDAKGNLVFAPGRRVALIGVEGLAVIESEGEILVCRLERDQDVKKASEQASQPPPPKP